MGCCSISDPFYSRNQSRKFLPEKISLVIVTDFHFSASETVGIGFGKTADSKESDL